WGALYDEGVSEIIELARRAREASYALADASRATKDAALHAMAAALRANTDAIVAANAKDVASAREAGTPESTVDRLGRGPVPGGPAGAGPGPGGRDGRRARAACRTDRPGR